ncbi:thiamine diphosphokinase [Mobilitalea sibirica]|uniref:Thiamine diphosphokinase n=1 Tax=Mobilitalea sibirica TaxID=1462919 RepID=A0A8J7H7X5_9FIRM|nr:thiamine diphosphokinase [Mobilitalea sibirica]MBH1941356.1 thiamine diphosphokinase [Mobilitalea sibirica]
MNENNKTINNNILIITGGHVDEEFLKHQVLKTPYTMVIAADHGLIAADQLKLSLDYIVGDFDSVSHTLLKKYQEISTPIKTFPTEKDKTDTQIAIELALMHNPSNIDIVGATGSRMDHVLANIHLLMLPMQLNVSAGMIDSNNKIYLKNKSFTIKRNNQFGNYVSLIPFTDKVTELTLKGFKYPLNNVTLIAGNSLGISNEIIEEEAFVDFLEGSLIVIEARD